LPLSTESFLASKIFTIVLCIFSSDESECILSEISKSLLVEKPVTPLLSLPFLGLYLDHVPSNH